MTNFHDVTAPGVEQPRPYPHRQPHPSRESAPTVVPAADAAVPPAADAEAGDRLFSWRAVLAGIGRYYTPPAPWATPAASLDELASYAHVGEWAAPRGMRRGLGIAYWYTVGLPCTVACRYGEWFAQRPGRLVTLLFVGAVLYRTTRGHWVAHALGQVFHYLFLPLTWLY